MLIGRNLTAPKGKLSNCLPEQNRRHIWRERAYSLQIFVFTWREANRSNESEKLDWQAKEVAEDKKATHPVVGFHPSQGRPHSNPAPTNKYSGVRTHFHTTSGHCCNASQMQEPCLVTQPLLSNGELCDHMQTASSVSAIQSYQCGLLIRKCKVGHL